jgi:hypothetical protein
MGRPRKALSLERDASEVLDRLKDKKLDGWQSQRLSAVGLGLEGHRTLPQIAEEVGVGAQSILHHKHLRENLLWELDFVTTLYKPFCSLRQTAELGAPLSPVDFEQL